MNSWSQTSLPATVFTWPARAIKKERRQDVHVTARQAATRLFVLQVLSEGDELLVLEVIAFYGVAPRAHAVCVSFQVWQPVVDTVDGEAVRTGLAANASACQQLYVAVCTVHAHLLDKLTCYVCIAGSIETFASVGRAAVLHYTHRPIHLDCQLLALSAVSARGAIARHNAATFKTFVTQIHC